MNEREIWDALGDIDDRLIEEAGKRLAEKGELKKARERRRDRRRIAMRACGMAAMAGLVIFLGASYGNMPEESYMRLSKAKILIQRASDPERPERPEGLEVAADQDAGLAGQDSDLTDQESGLTEQEPGMAEEKKVAGDDAFKSQSSSELIEADVKMREFFETSIRQTLLDREGENMAFSPVNLYLSLGMLSEMGGGHTRQGILSVMGEEKLEAARKRCMGLQSLLCWRNNTFESVLGHSLWLGGGIDYGEEMVGVLAENHCASVFREPESGGRAQMAQLVESWMNDFQVLSTECRVGEETSRSGFDLLSVVSFGERWREGKGLEERDVTEAERYQSVALELSAGSRLSIYLPKEGVEVEEMLRKDLRGMLSGSRDGENENGEHDSVQVSLPKFQVSSNIVLNDVLEGMGLQDIFREGKGDFSPLLAEESGERGAHVGKIWQSGEFVVDEAGCRTRSDRKSEEEEGAEDDKGLGQENDHAFICNRPFVFILWSGKEIPVLAGVVHDVK